MAMASSSSAVAMGAMVMAHRLSCAHLGSNQLCKEVKKVAGDTVVQ